MLALRVAARLSSRFSIFETILHCSPKLTATNRNTLYKFSRNHIQSTLFSTNTTEKKIMVDPKRVVSYEDMLKVIQQPEKVIIDVRNPDEIESTGKIPSSINIPLNNVRDALALMSEEEFQKNYQRNKPTSSDELIFYCRSGKRSTEALDQALKLGYAKMENRVSREQSEYLLDHLDKHRDLAKGVGLGARSKETVDKRWDALALKLNAMGTGASKSGLRWKRYWIDLKCRVKSRAAVLKSAFNSTGAGPNSQALLSETDEKVLDIIGEAAVHGDTQYRIPVFANDIPSTSTSNQVNSTAAALDPEPIVVEEPEIELSPSRRGQTPGQTRVSQSWVVDLETRRVAAEEKMAEAASVMAQAASQIAQAALLHAQSHQDLLTILKAKLLD